MSRIKDYIVSSVEKQVDDIILDYKYIMNDYKTRRYR